MRKISKHPRSDKTLTIGEFIEILKQYPSNAAIVTIWEGVTAAITKDELNLSDSEYYLAQTLEINAENYTCL